MFKKYLFKSNLINFMALLGLCLVPVRGADVESRLPIHFSMVEYLQSAPDIRGLHYDLGFTVEYEVSHRFDLGLAYRTFSGNLYYTLNPKEINDFNRRMAERTIVYGNYGCLDVHLLKSKALFFRSALGIAGITEESMIPYYTTYNYTWVPTALLGLGYDLKVYKNVSVTTQSEIFFLPYYKQNLITNAPWVAQIGLGLTFN